MCAEGESESCDDGSRPMMRDAIFAVLHTLKVRVCIVFKVWIFVQIVCSFLWDYWEEEVDRFLSAW